MCSILVFAKADNVHPDPSLDWTKFKRGDVIGVNDDDDFYWGNDIEGPNALGWWKVVVVPGVRADAMNWLLEGDAREAPGAPRRLRVNMLDLEGIEAKAKKHSGRLVVSHETVQAHRKIKPAIEASATIGSPRKVLG